MFHGLVRPVFALLAVFACSVEADIVRYTYTGNVNVAGSPFFGGAFEFRTQFDLGVAPTLSQVLPDEDRYTMNALSHWLKITGAPVGNGTYTAVAPVVFGAQDEHPPSVDLDSLTYNGVFNTTIGNVGLKMITMFANSSVLSTIATSPPVFSPSDATLLIFTHTANGAEYNLSSNRVKVEVFPAGTGLPEASSVLLFGAGATLIGVAVARRKR